jgi:predicted MFS family arabinose efflux permease
MNTTQHTSSWGQIILIYVLCVLGAATISQAVPVVGDIAREFHPSRQLIGYIISIPSAVVAVGAVLTGFFVDRLGDKPILLWGCVAVILGDVGVAFSATINQLLLMRAVEGLGFVCITVGTVTMLTRTTDGNRRTSALTLWSTFVPMSFAVPLVLAAQLSGSGHWRWAFLGHAASVGVLALLGLARLPASLDARVAMRTGGLRSVLTTPAVYFLGISFGAVAFLQTGVVSTLPSQLADRFGTPTGLAAGIGTLGMAFNALGSVSVGPMLNRGIGGRSIAAVGALVAVVAGCGFFLPGVSFPLAVVASLVYFLGSGLVVGLWAALPLVTPSPRAIGATSGLVTQLTLLGVLFGPPAAFAALSAGRWTSMGFNIVASMAVCFGAVALALRRHSK